MSSANRNYVENKMGVMPLRRLVLSMSAPIMISMFIQSMYNLVDSIFVSRVSEEALTAVSLSFPVQQFVIAVAIGTAVGMNSFVSRSLGAGNIENANKAAGNGIALTIISYLMFLFIGLFLSDNIISLQTGSKDIIEHGTIYLKICTVGSFGLMMHLTLERILQAIGKTFQTMIAQSIGAILNIILDPILIFGLLGFPAMGLKGAAVATVFSQIIGSLIVFFFCIKQESEVKLSFKYLKIDSSITKQIYKVGLPSIIMISIISVTIFSINKILSRFSTTAVALMGIYYRLQGFIFMPIFGLNNGIIPIIGYNYGAKNYKRMKDTIKLGMKYGFIIMLIGTILIELFPRQLLNLFNASNDMMSIGLSAFRIMGIGFVFAGISIISSGTFQALGKGMLSLKNTAIRQICVLIPLLYFLSLMNNIDVVWWALPISEIIAMIVCSIDLKKMLINVNFN